MIPGRLSKAREWDEAVATRIDYFEASRERMRTDLCRKGGLPVGSGILKASASESSGAASNDQGAAGRMRAPMLCPLSNAVSKPIAGPTSLIGKVVASQPPNP